MADSDGDAEWSEGSDIEEKQEEQVVGTDMDSSLRRQRIKHQSQNPKSRSRSCPVPVRPYKAVQPLQPSYDTTDLIMDRIDAGIYSLTGPLPAAPTKLKKKRPSKAERNHLRDQGVEFDTGDETAGEIKAALKAQAEKERSTDTGVSTASVHEDFLSSVENTPRQIVGKVDTYSEHDLDSDDELKALRGLRSPKMIRGLRTPKKKKHTDQLSDLDSDTAQQIEEKFIQILKKKRGGYLRDLKVVKQRPSDLESIRTEDFEEKIKQCIPVKKGLHQARPAKPKAKTRVIRECDLDSVLTEDIAMEFMKTMPKEMINTRKSPSRAPKQPVGRRLIPVPMSDADSIQTEDYENQFHTMMVKQVAKVPITNFDQMLVDSDLDTVRSQMIHDRIHSVTQRDYPDSIQSSELEEAKVEAIIERKLHEFFAKRGGKQIPEQTSTLPVTNSLPPSRSAHSLYTDTEDEEEEEEERNSIIRTSSPTRHSPARFGAENTQEEAEDPGKASDLIRQSSPTRSWHSANNSITASPNASFLGDMSRASNDTVIENQDVGSPDEVQKVVHQKKSALRELKSLHDTLKQNKEDIRQTERQIKDNRMKAEEARTQLMLAEFKRDSANKELEHLTGEISRRREELNEVEESIDRAHDKASEEEEKKISLNKEEIVKMTLERDELKAKLRSKETMEVEKQELEHQLISTKENFLTEQKRHRKRIEEMQEEMDSKQHKMDELLGEKDGLEKRINKLENKHRQMEQEKNEIIKEKTKEYQGVKERLQKELQETRTINSKEAQELRQQLKETADQLSSIQTKADSQEDANSSLKDKLSELEKELKENVSRLENLQEEKQTTIKNLMAEKEDELNHLKRALEEEKVTEIDQNRERLQNQLDQLREAHEREKQEILLQSQQAVQQEAAQLQSVISAKELEVEVLKDRISQQEESSRLLSDKLKQETMDQVRNALRAEREQWQADKEAEITHQLDSQRQEMQRNMVRLREELDTERHISEQQLQQITALKQELEEARQQQREAYRDRIIALNQTKELAKEEKEREIAILKNKIEQESNRELARLKESSGRQDEEMKRLREEKQELIHREKESVAMLERQEKTLVYEINDECRKIANMLGVEAKIINVSGYGSGKNTFTSPAWSKSQLLAATSAAVSNLRECTNEMRRHYDQVGREVQGMKQKIRDLDQRKREELEAQREKMQNEKMRAMEQLKERLIQEHLQEIDKLRDSLGRGKNLHKSLREKDKELKEIQINMKGWKDETVEKISKKFQDEMNREIEKRSKDLKQQKRELDRRNASQQREIERLQREVNRLSMSKSTPAALNTPSTPTRRAPSPLPATRRAPSPSRHLSQSFTEGEGGSDTVKLLNHLQGRVKQLHAENISLKRGTSTPNLADTSLDTVPVSERQSKLMQQQIDLANTKARLAEDRAHKQEGLLNQKMVELSKIQGTLTHQTKELMQLERAYSQLQQHANRIATRATAR